MPNRSRRKLLQLTAALAAFGQAWLIEAGSSEAVTVPCRIRTITAGVNIADFRDLRPVEAALKALSRARATFENAGFEVQTLRVATPAIAAQLDAKGRGRALPALRALDQLLSEHAAMGSIGPCAGAAGYDAEFATWVAEMIATTAQLSCSIRVAAPASGVNPVATRMAAETIIALANHTPGGLGNFRFAAAAFIPAGTPFFPVAFHEGPSSMAIGMESAALVEQALRGAPDSQTATQRLRELLNQTLAAVESIAAATAAGEGYDYLGIDSSPAPSLDRSIGAAIETLTGQAFGSSGTVDACAAVTAGLRNLQVKTCGYSGLMLPVVEDPLLAQRASEGRFGVYDLLLFSSVCGTGLDLTPIPGNTPLAVVEGIVRDMAALANRWEKPLSARLLLVPGKQAGEMATFDDPRLVACRVMHADRSGSVSLPSPA